MHPAAGLRRQEMRDAIEEDFAKIPGLLDVLRIQSEPAANSLIRETSASFETSPADQTRSLWDVVAPPDQENASPPPDLTVTDEVEKPNDPLPGQQRLF